MQTARFEERFRHMLSRIVGLLIPPVIEVYHGSNLGIIMARNVLAE